MATLLPKTQHHATFMAQHSSRLCFSATQKMKYAVCRVEGSIPRVVQWVEQGTNTGLEVFIAPEATVASPEIHAEVAYKTCTNLDK